MFYTFNYCGEVTESYFIAWLIIYIMFPVNILINFESKQKLVLYKLKLKF